MVGDGLMGYLFDKAAVDEPVMLGPVQVNPGYIAFADEIGIVIIPAAKLALVLRKCIEIHDAEDSRRAQIAGDPKAS